MVETKRFLSLILNTISEHIAVIDEFGDIQYINQSWEKFGENNNYSNHSDWYGQNYFRVCEAAGDDEYAAIALQGIKSVVDKKEDEFYLEYPCNSDVEIRWFMMRVFPLNVEQRRLILISHLNITERKLAEEQLDKLARMDSLTQIANRRYLDSFLSEELNRCQRLGLPLSIAMVDLDDFKLINDSLGHLFGDNCLKKVAELLSNYARRPSDLCARFGGEEFALVLGSVYSDKAIELLNSFRNELAELNIYDNDSAAKNTLTVSVGLVTLIPNVNSNPTTLIERADSLLYKAKKNGKNQIIAIDECAPANSTPKCTTR